MKDYAKVGWGRIRSDSYCITCSPGNGSKYQLLITHIPSPGAFSLPKEGGLVISLLNFNKSMILPYQTGEVHWSYVTDKFKLSKVDAEPIAELINDYYARLLDETNADKLIEQ